MCGIFLSCLIFLAMSVLDAPRVFIGSLFNAKFLTVRCTAWCRVAGRFFIASSFPMQLCATKRFPCF